MKEIVICMKAKRNAVAVVLLAGVVIGSSLWIGLRSTNAEPVTIDESNAKTNASSYKPFDPEEVMERYEASQRANSKETASEPKTDETASSEESTQVSQDTVSLPVGDTSSAGQSGSVSEPSGTVSEPVKDPDDEPTDEPEPTVSEPEPPVSEPEPTVSEPIKTLEENAVSFRIKVTGTDGTPVPSASVLLGNIIGTTDENGVFERNVPPKTFDLFIDADGCVSHYEELVLNNETKWEMVVTLEYADQIRKLLDSAALHPYRTDNEELNRYLDNLFDELFAPGMDTYDKVITCYDWVIGHMSYKRPKHTHVNGYWECAYYAIQEGVGQCNCYSAVFTAMMRHLGLNCYYVGGSTSANGGGMTGHDWTIIEINGETYIFDPQVEDAIAARTSTKTVTYTRFCLLEPHNKYVYRSSRPKQTCMDRFEAFLEEHGSFLGN